MYRGCAVVEPQVAVMLCVCGTPGLVVVLSDVAISSRMMQWYNSVAAFHWQPLFSNTARSHAIDQNDVIAKMGLHHSVADAMSTALSQPKGHSTSSCVYSIPSHPCSKGLS